MNKIIATIIATALLISERQAFAHDYSKVWIAKSGNINGKTIRYFSLTNSECIFIQELIPRGAGKVGNESKICSYKENKFASDYSDVSLEDGSFRNNRLFLTIIFSHFRARPYEKIECEVIFDKENSTHLECDTDPQ